MEYDIVVLAGDGIGPEVVSQGVKVLEAMGKRFGHTFHFAQELVGMACVLKHSMALRPETLELCRRSDAVILGAVGDPRGAKGWDDARIVRESLLLLRGGLGVFANLRPVRVFPELVDASPLRRELVEGVDFIVARELTGGLYFSKPHRQWQTKKGRMAVDTLRYSEPEIRRILEVGFELARGRRKRLTSVDKANVLESSRLWRQMATEMAARYPDVQLEHMYVDNCAMQLVRRPASFDVIVTENMFGDILTDEAGVVAGSIGMLPSASLGPPAKGGKRFGLYEPVHGSAPDIAGQDKANPLATILSCALLLRYSLGLEAEARAVEEAVARVIAEGYRTPDLAQEGARLRRVSTREMGGLVVERVARRS